MKKSTESKEKLIAQNGMELGLKPDKYEQILLLALEQTKQDLHLLEDSIQKNDFEAVSSLSHKIKGMFANLRVQKMANSAQIIDSLARECAALAKINEAFAVLNSEYEKLINTFIGS
ncbi:Hpt domain-containing protein [bacterium]|nr:Hpt domain-containing protein [bacterium]